MKEHEHLLVCLAEECAEVQHVIGKALRFGLDDCHPEGRIKNRERLEQELRDLQAVIFLLVERQIITDWPLKKHETWIAEKQKRILHYMKYARRKKTLDSNPRKSANKELL